MLVCMNNLPGGRLLYLLFFNSVWDYATLKENMGILQFIDFLYIERKD